MKERATFPQDILTEGAYLMERPTSIDAQSIEKKWKDDSNDLLTGWLVQLEAIADFTAPSIESVFKAYIAEKNVGIGAVMFLFRLLVTGQGAGPSMFEISEFLGKQEVIDRLNWGLATVAEMKK
jgi:glutamyl-tRNA synthetase